MDQQNYELDQTGAEETPKKKKGSTFKRIVIAVIGTLLISWTGINVACLATNSQILITNKESADDGEGAVLDADTVSKINELTAYTKLYYYDDIENEKLQDGLYTGLIDGLGDKYSVYYNAEDYQALQVSTTGQYYGIGAGLSQDKDTMVVTVNKIYEGTPSESAGLLKDDVIVSVDGTEAASMELSELVKLIRGEKGTTVHLEIYRPSTEENLSFDVERQDITLPSVSHKMFEDGIGYVHIDSFETETAAQFEEAVKDLEDQGMKALIIDVRYNPGGMVTAVVQILDDILPEAFAVVREAAGRTLGMKHYRVQLIGGIILHQGRISEMKTGEGKTLVSTLPAYLNALTGEGVHIVTVNDYLAKRDAEWMGQVHEFLGLTVGVVLNSMDNDERRAAYNCDITYVTNNELGFDYLRDNMVIYKEQLVQRGLKYAIIDEVDSVLIDEARTPLIISGQSDKSTKLYEACDILARQLEKGEASGEFSKMNAIMGEDIEETGDFIVNEKEKNINLTEDGVKKVEKFFHIENLADPENLEIQHNIILALRAHNLMFRDQDYVVKDDEVLIVDEFTGRIMPGRRYSDGLHQAIEAKEHVKVKRESKTLATITFQNLFNKFEKKAGMTGTALTEEKEFREIYGMDVIEIPTNRPVARKDLEDAVYKTKKEKFNAVCDEIEKAHANHQPVLVGTITIETSELLSSMLKRRGIKHNVLNAKYHELEAEIVAQAGIHDAVTIATNMAGRGTDIKLDDESREAGGLKIIGTERHESRRIDNQLRGRSGRQGDPGESRFYISLEDDLMRLFGSERLMQVFETLGSSIRCFPVRLRKLSRRLRAITLQFVRICWSTTRL